MDFQKCYLAPFASLRAWKTSKYNWFTWLKVLIKVPADNIKDKLLVLNATEALEKEMGLNNI